MPSTITQAGIANVVFDALERLGVDPNAITRDATFAQLDVDSLDLAELTQIVEDQLGVSFADADFKTIKNVGDVLTCIEERI